MAGTRGGVELSSGQSGGDTLMKAAVLIEPGKPLEIEKLSISKPQAA